MELRKVKISKKETNTINLIWFSVKIYDTYQNIRRHLTLGEEYDKVLLWRWRMSS